MNDTLEPHPLADLFPEVGGAAYDRLRTAIRVEGQLEPIILHEGKILSGRARYRICCELRRAPLLANWVEPMGSPIEKLIEDNLRSRELAKAIRAVIAARIVKTSGGAAKDGEILLAHGAALLGVSPQSIQAARTILRSGTDHERKLLMEGKLSLTPVAEDIKRGVSPEQRAAVARLDTGRRPPSLRPESAPPVAPPPLPRKRRVLQVRQPPTPEKQVAAIASNGALPVPFATVQQALWTLIAASAAISPDQVSDAHVVATGADIERLILWLMEYGELQKDELQRDARDILMQRPLE